jgi:hypothetical protein
MNSAGITGTAKRAGLFKGLVASARKISSRLAVRSTSPRPSGRSFAAIGSQTRIEPAATSTISGQCAHRRVGDGKKEIAVEWRAAHRIDQDVSDDVDIDELPR